MGVVRGAGVVLAAVTLVVFAVVGAVASVVCKNIKLVKLRLERDNWGKHGQALEAMLISRVSTSLGVLTAAPMAWLARKRTPTEKMVVVSCIVAGSERPKLVGFW